MKCKWFKYLNKYFILAFCYNSHSAWRYDL